MRLIDADELLKQSYAEYCDYIDTWIEKVDVSTIDAAPTIDPVKHGSWLRKKPTYTERCVCSECFATGKYYVWLGVDGLNYCPHCGAKMDEVSE